MPEAKHCSSSSSQSTTTQTTSEASNKNSSSRFTNVAREPHIVYSGQLAVAFANDAPRLFHAQCCHVKGATYGLPDFNQQTGKLIVNRFQQTGFAVVRGKKAMHM
jgi:hypothetical protein